MTIIIMSSVLQYTILTLLKFKYQLLSNVQKENLHLVEGDLNHLVALHFKLE